MAFGGETAEIIVGVDGLTGTKNQAVITPSQLLKATNITYESGTIEKEGGSAKYNSSAITGTPDILGGWDWHPTASLQRMIVLASDGKLYRDTGDGSFGTTLKSSLTVSNVVPVFVEGGKEAAAQDRKLFLFTGINQVQVLAADGVTTSNLTSPPADWSGGNQPSFGLLHEDRMWGGGNANDPHRLYASLTTDHEDFTGTPYSIAIYPGEGERLIGAASFKGLIICWKYPSGMYIVDTSNSDNTKWRVVKHSTKIGGVSPLGHTLIDDDILFIDHTGSFHLLSAIDEYGNVGSRNLSDIAEFDVIVREEIDLSELLRTQCVYYVAKREAHFLMSTSGTSWDRRAVVDFNRVQLPRFRLSDKDTNRSVWLRQDGDGIERMMTGDNSGFVWQLDQANRSKDGSGYNGEFQTPHLDFSHLDPALGTIEKNGKFLEVVMEPVGNWTLSVDLYWDDKLTQTLQFNMGTSGSSLGAFVLGTDKLAGANLLNKRKRITGSGRRMSLVARNSGDGQDFSIAKFYLLFTRGSDLAA